MTNDNSVVTEGVDVLVIGGGQAGLAMRTVAAGDGLTLTVPVADPGYSTPVGSAVLWDEPAAQDMFAAIAKGNTSKLGKYAK